MIDIKKVIICNMLFNLATFAMVLSFMIMLSEYSHKVNAVVKRVDTEMDKLNIQNYTDSILYYAHEIKQEMNDMNLQNYSIEFINYASEFKDYAMQFENYATEFKNSIWEIYNITETIKQDINKVMKYFNHTF